MPPLGGERGVERANGRADDAELLALPGGAARSSVVGAATRREVEGREGREGEPLLPAWAALPAPPRRPADAGRFARAWLLLAPAVAAPRASPSA